MKYGSVCSGIEAASVAWAPLSWSASFVSEIDKFPCAVLAHRFPTVPIHGDFTTIEDNQYEAINLLVGGTPCQSFSIAGLRGGLDDDRGNLALEYLRLAQRLRPRWLVWENVPGVLSSGGGRDFGSILGGMVECGYGFAYRVLDAQFIRVDGFPRAVPQRRRRVFVVGYLGDWRRAAAVLFEQESLSGNPAPGRKARQRIADTLTLGANQCSGFSGDFVEDVAPTMSSRSTGGGGLGTDFECGGGLIPDVANTLTGRMHKGVNTTMDEGQIVLTAFEWQSALGVNPSKEVCHTLISNQTPAIAFEPRYYTRDQGGARGDQVTGALTAYAYGSSDKAPHVYKLHDAVRRLTPTECERLQGFPDGWTQIPYRGKEADACPDGPRYKALGNSMAVNVMRWIGQRIDAVDRLES